MLLRRQTVIRLPTYILPSCSVLCLFVQQPPLQEWPPRIEPWRPQICALTSFLNVAINKKPVFVPQVVTHKKVNGALEAQTMDPC